MTAHIDILDQRDPLGGALVQSVVIHGVVFAAIGVSMWLGGHRVQVFGHEDAAGNSVTVSAVSGINLPNYVRQRNPLADDTEALVRTKPQEATREQPDPDAVALGKKQTKQDQRKKLDLAQYMQNRVREIEQSRENQLKTSNEARVSMEMYRVPGSGKSVGTTNTALGTRFGYYEQLIRTCIGQKWNPNTAGANAQTSRPAAISFEILRDGQARNLRVLQTSGNSALDYTCQRAILDCSPFQPLPQGFERNSASVEFWFQLEK